MTKLSPRLVCLFSPYLLRKEHLKDPSGLLRKLQQPRDALGTHIRLSLPGVARELLDSYEVSDPLPEYAQKTMITELNLLLRNPSLYDNDAFQKASLSPETKALLDKRPGRWTCLHLNRLLVEQAFSTEIHEGYTVNWSKLFILPSIFIFAAAFVVCCSLFATSPISRLTQCQSWVEQNGQDDDNIASLTIAVIFQVSSTAFFVVFGVLAHFVGFRDKTDKGYRKAKIHSFRFQILVGVFLIAFALALLAVFSFSESELNNFTELGAKIDTTKAKVETVQDSIDESKKTMELGIQGTRLSTKNLLEMINTTGSEMTKTQRRLHDLIDTSIQTSASAMRDLINTRDSAQAERLRKHLTKMARIIDSLGNQAAIREKAAARRDTQIMEYISARVRESSERVSDLIERGRIRDSTIAQNQIDALQTISQRDSTVAQLLDSLTGRIANLDTVKVQIVNH